MSLSPSFISKALLKYNYFPRQRKDKAELPPCFHSKKFSPRIAKLLIAKPCRKNGVGWDTIAYRSTRFNGVPRMLSIPHPIPHALLSLFIADHWSDLAYIAKGKWSEIRPRQHSDGRTIIMDYEATEAKSRRQHTLSFGKRFRVHTDIANCFPSVYSHSVPWAVAGFSQAKAQKFDKTAWFNELDEKIRWCKRNETNGLAIGPATSNVIVEAILAKIDEEMATKSFVFVRYIDDYTADCDTEAQAQDFIHCLGVELDKYKLLLNIKKTNIDILPEPITSAWVSQLSLAAPKKPLLTTYDVANYLGFAQSLAKEEPDGSVIKYAVKVLLRAKMRPNARDFFLGELLVLAYHYPIIVPLLRKPLRTESSKSPTFFLEDYDNKLNFLLEHHAFHHRSDAMCWLLFFMSKLNFSVSDAACKRLIETKDCLALLLLFKIGSATQKNLVRDFTKTLNAKDVYELDAYWLLLYELYKDGVIKNVYGTSEQTFVLLKKEAGLVFQLFMRTLAS